MNSETLIDDLYQDLIVARNKRERMAVARRYLSRGMTDALSLAQSFQEQHEADRREARLMGC